MRSSSYKPSDSADALRDSDVFFLAATSHRETFFIQRACQTQMLLPVTANSEPWPRTARRDPSAGSWQRWENGGDESEYHVDWVVGSGNHASDYLVDIGGHLFQSPVAYYKSRQSYDFAPGYEHQSDPDFTRPVRHECVLCHSGTALHVSETLNEYRSPVFPATAEAITCKRSFSWTKCAKTSRLTPPNSPSRQRCCLLPINPRRQPHILDAFDKSNPRGPVATGFGSHVLEVRVAESRRIFQTIAQHAVHANVRQPDQGARLKRGKRNHNRDA